MIKECNFKQDSYDRENGKVINLGHSDFILETKRTYCGLRNSGFCSGEEKCVLFQIYQRLEILELIKGHEKTLNALAKK